MLCQHCGISEASRPRGLCAKHYAIAAIRKLYPPKIVAPVETMEELDALIEKQRANAPAWFWREVHDGEKRGRGAGRTIRRFK